MCVCVFGFVHMSVVSMKAKVVRCPRAGISCKLPDVCWEPNLGSLQEQQTHISHSVIFTAPHFSIKSHLDLN